MLDEHGQRLAKRNDSQALATLRQAGLTPAEVLARTDRALAPAMLALQSAARR